MPSVSFSAQRDHSSPGTSGGLPTTLLSSLAYRSRAVAPMSDDDLSDLVLRARSRNRLESITGMLIYDQGRFFQWLEGPAENVARIWRSVRDDRRHTAIEVLGASPVPLRSFGQWDLKCSIRGGPSRSIVSEIPDQTSMVIDCLNRCCAPQRIANAMNESGKPQRGERLSRLKKVCQMNVIPRLLERRKTLPIRFTHPPVDPHLGQLVDLLLAPELSAGASALSLIHSLTARYESLEGLYASVFEPAARQLGDRWSSDDCSDFDVTFALCRLQTAVRQIDTGWRSDGAGPSSRPSILVATLPGESHMLGVMLDAELLWQAGWHTQCEYPLQLEELEDLVGQVWFDALDLSLSPTYRRDHCLPHLAQAITRLRDASLNPSVVIVVGGRAFHENPERLIEVGADECMRSAAQLVPQLRQTMRARD